MKDNEWDAADCKKISAIMIAGPWKRFGIKLGRRYEVNSTKLKDFIWLKIEFS